MPRCVFLLSYLLLRVLFFYEHEGRLGLMCQWDVGNCYRCHYKKLQASNCSFKWECFFKISSLMAYSPITNHSLKNYQVTQIIASITSVSNRTTYSLANVTPIETVESPVNTNTPNGSTISTFIESSGPIELSRERRARTLVRINNIEEALMVLLAAPTARTRLSIERLHAHVISHRHLLLT